MATEKILIFDEAGNAKRMKVRIARFLDNEPVTASDKENIRTTLDVDDSLSGTFTTPLSVTSASDSSFTGGGNVGIGTSTPTSTLDIEVSGANGAEISLNQTGTNGRDFRIGSTGTGYGSAGNLIFYDATAGAERWRINSTGNLVAGSGLGIDFGSTTTGTGTVTGGLLNDYEFGDFTVTAGGAWTVTPTSMGGRYVKVGNLVTCWVTFGGSPSKTSATSGWLEGLPFATNVYPGQGSVSDTSVVDRGNCYAANVNRLWLTGTSFGVNSYATVTYRHD